MRGTSGAAHVCPACGAECRGPRVSQVYFMQAETRHRQVKIGRSFDPLARKADLEAEGGKNRLVLLASAPGDAKTEANLHRLFAEHRIYPDHPKSEWFYPVPALLAFAELVAKTGEVPWNGAPPSPPRAQGYIERGPVELARYTQVLEAAIGRARA